MGEPSEPRIADLLFFSETSALYGLSVAEVLGIPVDDTERAKLLVFGMLLGQKSQSQVSRLAMWGRSRPVALISPGLRLRVW